MLSLGYLATAFLALALIAMFMIWPPDPTKTLSENIARRPASTIYYACMFIIFLILFTPFFWETFPQTQLHKLYVIGAVSEIIASLVPDRSGLQSYLHRIFAGLMALSSFLLVVLTQFTVLTFIVAVYMLVCWALLSTRSRLRRHALLLELLYFAGFLTVLLSIAAGYNA